MGYHQIPEVSNHPWLGSLPIRIRISFFWISSCRMEILFIYRTGLSYKSHYLYDRFDEYAVRAFTVNSIDYLLKPIRQERLEEAIQKFEHVTSKYNQKLLEQNDLLKYSIPSRIRQEIQDPFHLISGNEKLITLQVEDIAYFYSLNKITFFVTRQKQRVHNRFPLDKLMEQLDPLINFSGRTGRRS